jgi:hypothetical protein
VRPECGTTPRGGQMKSLRMSGLCVLAACALSVMLTASAQAAKVEHGELDLLIAGPEGHFGSARGSLHFTSIEGSAAITSATGGTATLAVKGTEIEGTGLKCHSAGEPVGIVKSKGLNLGSGWISKPTEAGIDLKPASGYLFEVECEGGTRVKIKGSVVGQVTPLNTSTLELKLNLIPNASKKANSPEKFEGGSQEILESEWEGTPGEFETLLQLEASLKNHGNASVCRMRKTGLVCKPLPFEFHTLNGNPEFGRCDKVSGGKYSDNSCSVLATKKGKYEFVPLPG